MCESGSCISGPQPAGSQGLEFQKTNASGAGLGGKTLDQVASLKEFVTLLRRQ